MSKPRALAVVRLSRDTDDSTSVERQTERIKDWAKFKGHEIIGWAVDDGVSAIKVSPWDRPKLGPWLDRAQEYDSIVCWKIDRLARRTKDFVDLLHWADGNSISIHTTDDDMDLSSDTGRMVAHILAIFADFEGRTIKLRAKQSRDGLMARGRWPGGATPYGYNAVKDPSGGWRLEIDPEARDIVREVFARVTEGYSIRSICKDLTERGVPSPADRLRKNRGDPMKGSAWVDSGMAAILRSPALLGQRMHGGEVVRDQDTGLPMQFAEPILTGREWSLLQKTLDENGNGKGPLKYGKAPLLGVIWCLCGSPIYRHKNRSSYSYRCWDSKSKRGDCDQRTFPADSLEWNIFDDFLKKVGHLEVQRKTFDPGSDHTEDLETAEKALEDLTALVGTARSTTARERLRNQIRALDERIAHLESLPSRPAGYVYEGTGETFSQLFERLSNEDKGSLLKESGVKARVFRLEGAFAKEIVKNPNATVENPHGIDLDRDWPEQTVCLIGLPKDLEKRAQEWAANRS